jgi:hypothetical protein
MSHAATKWAFDQPELHRDMKPSEWAVLMVLADCHNPVNGCFPSQDYICAKTNLAERAVRDQLARLRERGLIDWDAARDGQRRGSNRYRLGFEADFLPANSAGRDDAASTGENAQSQPADSDTLNRQNLPPNLVREPVKEPVERERGRDEGLEENPKAVERAFERAYRAWPTSIGDSRPEALKAWAALSPDERTLAADEAERYHAAVKASGRKHVVAHAVYLREKRWEQLPPREAEAKPAFTEAAPFGPLWQAARMKRLLAGPDVQPQGLTVSQRAMVDSGHADERELMLGKQAASGWPSVNRMHDQATARKGVTVSTRIEALATMMVPVPVGSEAFEAWKLEHALRGWPWLPDPGRMPVVYFPAGGPGGLEAFEAAIRGDGHDGVEQQAAE